MKINIKGTLIAVEYKPNMGLEDAWRCPESFEVSIEKTDKHTIPLVINYIHTYVSVKENDIIVYHALPLKQNDVDVVVYHKSINCKEKFEETYYVVENSEDDHINLRIATVKEIIDYKTNYINYLKN